MKLKARGDLNGFLDAGSHIRGDLHFDDTFRIDGRLTGKAVSKGNLVVGENGEVDAEIDVGGVYVSGTVRGQVKASERIEIAAGGRVYADLHTPVLVVEDGAILEGHCSMSRSEPAKRPQAVVTKLPVQDGG